MERAESMPRRSVDWVLLGATAALLALGLMMVYSASADLGFRLKDDGALFFRSQLLFCGVGALAMLVASRVHYRFLTKISIPFMAVVLLMLIWLAISRSRQLMGGSGSASEFAKLALVIYIAHWLASKRVEQLRKLPVGPLPFTIIVGVVAGLVMRQPDISEAIVIVLMAVAMFFLAGADWLQFLIGAIGGTAAFVAVIKQFEYTRSRFEPFALAWPDPISSNHPKLYQLREGLIGMGAGGIFGTGPGNGRLSYVWLPAAHNDSIFAVVGEELGLIGCLLIIGLFALFIYRGFAIARRCPDPFGRLLAVGITCWVAFQALMNMAVVTGTIPSSGLTLPFISHGGSSLVMCMVGVGIMLSISRAESVQGVPSYEAGSVGRGDGRTRLPSPDGHRSPA